ncbi:MAG: hypothetical protein NVSMB19_06330 [Vulcanimicrobiaceae bacterium]
MKQSSSGRVKPEAPGIVKKPAAGALPQPTSSRAATPAKARQSVVAKVSHTLTIALAERLEEFAFFQRISESAVIEHSLSAFFAQSEDDGELGDILRRDGAGRRRKS